MFEAEALGSPAAARGADAGAVDADVGVARQPGEARLVGEAAPALLAVGDINNDGAVDLAAAALALGAAARVATRGEIARSTRAVAVAATAMLGSLYFSEIAGLPPCEMCWFQRGAMYPLSVLLLIAALRGDTRAWRYIVPVAAVGLLFSMYHYQLELFPEDA